MKRLLLLLLIPLKLNSYSFDKKLIVWNVGQGQWLTYVTNTTCLHIDMGGESANFNKVSKLCYQKNNPVLITHNDYDHIGFINKAFYRLPNLCLVHKNSSKYLKKIPLCKTTPANYKEIVHKPSLRLKVSKNDLSKVFKIGPILIPGDSTKRQEKLWSLRKDYLITILIAGHHGSKTSTSKYLLRNLPRLKQAIASARYKKYKHPHWTVDRRLKIKCVALISTEHWGNIHIEM